jgi:hypothetical protein
VEKRNRKANQNKTWIHMKEVREQYNFGCGCHTLKYLILGCEYLLQCVYPSLGFFENFLDFSGKLFTFSVELNPFIGKF